MRARKLTDIAICNLKPAKERYEISDLHAKGLRVVIHPSGTRTFVYRYWYAGKPRKLTFENVTSLAAARKLAGDAQLKVAQGRNPAAEKQKRKQQEREAAAQARATAELLRQDGMAALAAQFISKHARALTRSSSAKATERIFRNIILPAWPDKTVHQVKRRDIIDLLEFVAEGGKGVRPRPIQANRTHAVLRKFFNWCVARDIIPVSPCLGVVPPAKEVARERVLNDAEIVALWRACDEIHPRYGAFVRLLLLTAQRRREVAELPWGEIDKNARLWGLPKERAKNGKAHVIPLSTQAWHVIKTAPAGKDSAYVLGRRIDAFNRIKRELDARLKFDAPWVLHDLRRSAASGLQKVGAPPHVVERILNHHSGAFRGVAGVYQRDPLLNEMTVALQRWADYVERLVTGQADDNVLAMRKVAASGERA
jgi:integrase